MIRRIFPLLLAAFLPWMAQAQTQPDSVETLDEGLDPVIEDAIIDIEADEQVDFTIYTDFLDDLKRKPLSLNSASKDELLLLPGITEILATNLLNYINEFGALTSIYELQAVPGFDVEVFRKIQPYVTVKESRAKDINPGVFHPSGPGLKTIFSEANHELLLRFVSLIEDQKGFTDPDTNSDGSLTSRYLGNRHKYYFRYRMRYQQNFSVALVGEKDQGEEFKWDPQNQFYGFDFAAGHIFIRDYGHVKRLVVGDYNLQTGQGLILSTGLGFGKGTETVSAVKRTNFGIRPYASVNENQFMRGAAATLAWGNIYVTPFFSRMTLDANITEEDTFSNEVTNVSTLQTSGFHRTPSELLDKDAIQEMIYGGRVEYKNRFLTVGATHYFQDYGSTIAPSNNDYQIFNFAGDQNFLTGFDFDAAVRNINVFGEFARSKSGGTASTVGLIAALNRKCDFAISFRNFERDFHSTRGFAFAERPTTIRNERGVYMGIKVMPSTKWTISTFVDQFWFPWHNYQVSFPSRGNETMVQVEYKPSRKWSIYSRFRVDNKERNASELADGQQLEVLVPTSRKGLRFHFSYKVHRTLTLKTRIEQSWYTRGEEENSRGILAYQDISWKLGWKWKVTARYALFDAPDYDARIYAFENDVLGFFSIPAYSQTGSRYYIILNYKPTRHLEFWARFARSKFLDQRTVGSGLNEIQGNQRSEVKLQMRIKF